MTVVTLGIKLTYNTFSQYYYILFLEDGFHTQFIQKVQTAPIKFFLNMLLLLITGFQGTQKDTHILVDAFSHSVLPIPIKSNNAKTAVKSLLHHWIIKFGPTI